MPLSLLQPRLVARWAFPALLLFLGAAPVMGSAAFSYSPIADPIINATFSVDFAGLTAHRFIGAVEVNHARLIDPAATLADADLSADLFGFETWPDPTIVDQGDFDTGLVSATIPAIFFPVLASGEVGLSSLFTDTNDAAFAIDTIFITIETATDTFVAEYGSPNDGFGIGLPDGNVLPSPLPDSIPVGATGTGFDETVTSKSIHVVPEPAVLIMMALGGLFAAHRRRSTFRPAHARVVAGALLAASLVTSSALAFNAAWDGLPAGNNDRAAKVPALQVANSDPAPQPQPIGAGEPDQLHVAGPLPNEIIVGTEGELIVTVESAFVGVPGVSLVYTKLMGEFTFQGGVMPGPGDDVANDTTDINGQSFMTIEGDAVGPALIEISIPGSPLSPVYSLFEIITECVPDCPVDYCGTDGCGNLCECENPNAACFMDMCISKGPTADVDIDGDIDLGDFSLLARCFDPAAENPAAGCQPADVNGDNQVDLLDYSEMEEAMTGPQ